MHASVWEGRGGGTLYYCGVVVYTDCEYLCTHGKKCTVIFYFFTMIPILIIIWAVLVDVDFVTDIP